MRAVQQRIDQFTQSELATLQRGQNLTVQVEGESLELTPEDVQVERIVLEGVVAANEGAITIALDTALTEDLLKEGLAREIVNKINTMRREGGFSVTDRIHVTIDSSDRVKESFNAHADYIKQEVLALNVVFGMTAGTAWDLNGETATISLERVHDSAS